MAAEEDEVDIEGIGEDDDLVDYKDMIENSDVISCPKKANVDRSSSSFFSEFCDPSSWFVDPNAVLSLDHCEDEKSRQTIEKMILEEELYSHGYGRMLEVPTTPVSGSNKTAVPSKKTSPKSKKSASIENNPKTHRKPWTKQEQQLFQIGLQKFGRSWTRIASMIDTRTVLQVKNYANQYFKNKDKTKPDIEGLALSSDVKPSSDHVTCKAPIDNGPLVHIEKTSDEEEIEVDIDGVEDMDKDTTNTDTDTEDVYEALIKAGSDSEDSGNDNEEDDTKETNPSTELESISLPTVAQQNELQIVSIKTPVCQSYEPDHTVMETSTGIDQSNDVKDVTVEMSVTTQSKDMNKSANENPVKCILNGHHNDEIVENDYVQNIKDLKDSEHNKLEAEACSHSTSDENFESNLEKHSRTSRYDKTLPCNNEKGTNSKQCDKTQTNPKTLETTGRATERVIASSGEVSCNETTACDAKRPTLDLSEVDLQIDRNEIHEVEKDWNQEFFMGRSLKTPSRYMKIRNHILDLWEKCKPEYLYKTSVRTGLKNCGDVNSIGRVHAFLEDIGAINEGCPERSRPRQRPASETGSEVGDDAPPMESWVNFLRPRKRRIKDESGDWVNESDGEGLTKEHSAVDDEEDHKQGPCERPYRKPRAAKRKLAYNPFLLVPCQKFPSSSALPFAVIFQSDSLVVIDVHSHLSTTEVIGLLGGTYCSTQRVLKILRAAPCKSLSTGMQCEMDPVSQTQASEELASIGLSVVGWYHSHPTFASSPSVRDIETQGKFQEWFGKGGAPFVGVIASPYNYSNTSNQSQITTMTVGDEWDATDQYRLPCEFDYSIQDDVTDWSSVLDCVRKLEGQYRGYEYRMPMTRRYGSSAFTALDKLVESLRPRLRGTVEQQQEFIEQLRNLFTKDGETWSNERQDNNNDTSHDTT